jgi:UDP-N-acetylmuramoyl-L-alanyl-D-glutamate--2,6-diaminopimelate ligase
VCHHLKTKLSLFFPQPCRHNVQNALAAVAVGVFYGISLAEALERMSQFPGVPGRLEPVNNRRGLHIFIDYAHTDDALKSVLGSLRQLEKRSSSKPLRVLTVFGCGGDRDKGKRPLMARAALEHSDLVVVTSDNPRNEDPQQIIEDIVGGLPTELLKKTKTIVDRREAIRYALEVSQPGDVIVIAGKGHEDYQIIGKERIPFSDRQVVSSLL